MTVASTQHARGTSHSPSAGVRLGYAMQMMHLGLSRKMRAVLPRPRSRPRRYARNSPHITHLWFASGSVAIEPGIDRLEPTCKRYGTAANTCEAGSTIRFLRRLQRKHRIVVRPFPPRHLRATGVPAAKRLRHTQRSHASCRGSAPGTCDGTCWPRAPGSYEIERRIQ